MSALTRVGQQLPAHVTRQAAAQLDRIHAIAAVTEDVIDEVGQLTRYAEYTANTTLVQSAMMRAASGATLTTEEQAAIRLLDAQFLETIITITDRANAKLVGLIDQLPENFGRKCWWE
jgi:hypothetical protein